MIQDRVVVIHTGVDHRGQYALAGDAELPQQRALMRCTLQVGVPREAAAAPAGLPGAAALLPRGFFLVFAGVVVG